jgi:hypothetical protein
MATMHNGRTIEDLVSKVDEIELKYLQRISGYTDADIAERMCANSEIPGGELPGPPQLDVTVEISPRTTRVITLVALLAAVAIAVVAVKVL